MGIRATASLWVAAALIFLGSPLEAQTPPPQVQELPLNTGWNLISLQVAPAGVSVGTLQSQLFHPSSGASVNSLLALWSFNNTTRSWVSYQATNANFPHDLLVVVPGQGCWVQVNQACVLRLTNQPWEGAVLLNPGWNLVGFPGLRVDSSGMSLEGVFRASLPLVQQVWTFDSTPAASRYVGMDSTARPALRELSTIQPGKAYWVYSLGSTVITLSNSPAIALPGDIDNPPLQTAEAFNGSDPRFKGSNAAFYANRSVRFADTNGTDNANDLNGNGIVDEPFTQDTLFFPEGINTRTINVLNEGSSRLNWYALETISWLNFATANNTVASASMSPELVSAQAGRVQQNGTNFVFGSVALEPGFLTVQVDRSALVPGRYTNTFTIWAGELVRTVKVIVAVPPIDGDWRGYAATRRVNGKDVAIGKVDLTLAIFRQGTNLNEPNIRAVIKRDESLLFPRDVFLNGAFYADSEFFLTSNFQVAKGDRNAPPYDKFANGGDAKVTGFGDIDLNGDKKLDNSNPFPFDLRREVSLLGRKVSENRLEGDYVESIQGLLPGDQKIYIEGRFELERRTLVPSLTSIFNRSIVTNSIIGDASGKYTVNINVTNDFTVEGVTGNLIMDFGLGANVAVRLVRPDGTSVTLFGPTNGISGAQSFTADALKGSLGTGLWKLDVTWNPNGERGNFSNFDLNLKGTASYGITGLVAIVTGGVTNAFTNATALLSGNNLVAQKQPDAAGRFVFTNLTENDFTLLVSAPGYQEASMNVKLFDRSVDVGTIVLQPLTNATSTLLASPGVGGQPFHSVMIPVLTTADRTALGTITSSAWSFGDGSSSNITSSLVSPLGKTFTNAAYYTNILTLNGSGGSLNLTNFVLVLPQAPKAGVDTNLFGIGFIGSVAGGATTNAAFEHSSVNTNLNITVAGSSLAFASVTAANYQQAKRDLASFDLDRFPFSTFSGGTNTFPGLEDTDYTLTPNAVGFRTNQLAVVNGVSFPDRFRMVTTLGGFVFGTAPSRVATFTNGVSTTFMLQVGRIED